MPATVLGLLNSPEFVGYYYAGFLNSQTGNGIFAKSSLESSYVWTFDKAAPPNGEAAASFLPMMFFPGQGGAGVQYLYGRPGTAATYESMPIDADWFGASADVLARLNAMGAQGYCRQSGEWDAPKMALIRQQGASDRCAYEFKAFPRDVMSDSLETLNAMGDRGFVPFTSVASRGTYYVKVSNDSTTYYYYVVDAVMSSDVDWLAQLNTEGAKGGAQYAFVAASGSTPAKRVFRIATQCTRTWLCR
ncbi:hypothetical protein AO062_26490 [Variovorax boronicumulans]|nr:hypothetical protein AO062_26490 [Variovorax boronicumulans]